jgi:hypothetical protein
MGINLRIKRFNLQSQIHVRFPILENTNERFSKIHNHLIEHSDSDKLTSKKKHNLTFCRSIVKSNQVVI